MIRKIYNILEKNKRNMKIDKWNKKLNKRKRQNIDKLQNKEIVKVYKTETNVQLNAGSGKREEE